MRLARLRTAAGIVPAIHLDGRWHGVDDHLAPQPVRTGESWGEGEVRFAAPCTPVVVLGLAHNGSAADRAAPPQAFAKSARTVVGEHDPIVVDEGIGRVDVEGELAIVIGRAARHLTAENALDHVLGWTIANDVTAVDQNALDPLLLQSKNGDGYTPLGPWIETELDPAALGIRVVVDGVEGAVSSTDRLGWSIVEQLVYLTAQLELGPGDVVLTGSPETFVAVRPGSISEITIEGIGTLVNPVVGGRPRAPLPTP